MKNYLFFLFLLASYFGWGQTAVYLVTGTTAVATSGTIPVGSTSSYSQTYNTAKQITSGNSATLNLSGYSGKKITSIILEMRSNGSAGAGRLFVTAGSTSLTSINPAVAFNNSQWYGAWSTIYVDIVKIPISYDIQSGEDVQIRIEATANSLYIQKFTIVYENSGCNSAEVTSSPSNQSVMTNENATFSVAGTGSVQWQVNSGSGWNNIVDDAIYSGATINTLSVANPPITMSGNSYRAILSQACDNTSATTNAASLTVTPYVGPCHNEEFNNLNISNASYANRNWAGEGGTWSATDAREDQSINGKAITIRSGILTSPTFSDGIGSITMTTKLNFSDQAGNLDVKINGVSVGFIPYSSTVQTTTISNINISGNVVITVHSSGARVSIDDVNWTCYAATPQPPVITSSLTQSTEYGAAASYIITADYLPTSFSATGLPTGLSINTSTGVISGTVTANVGTYTVAITATNDEGSDTKNLVWNITPKALSVNLSVSNKIYDGNTIATIAASPAPTLVGIVGSDNVVLSGSPLANFTDKNVGTNKTVNISGYTLSGADNAKYSLIPPTALANISAKPLSITSPTIADKVYDGSATTGSISIGILSGVVGIESLGVSASGTYTNSDAGTGKIATIFYTLSDGTDGGLATNYTLANGTGTGNITKANPVISPASINVNVGGTYTLPGGISSNSNGTLSFSMTDNVSSTLTGGNTINGIAVGTNILTVNQAEGTNHFAGSETITVNVSQIVYVNGDFRSYSDGTWTNNATPGTARWEKLVSGTWVLQPAGTEPSGAAGSYTVYISHDIEVPSGGVSQLATAKLHVLNGGNFIFKFTSNQWTFRNIIIENGGIIDMIGRFTVLSTGEFEIKDGGTFIHNYPSQPASSSGYFWSGLERFHPNSNFIVRDHPTGSSNYFLPSESSLTSNTYNGITAYFGNLIFEVPTRISNGNLSSTSTYLTHGNLEFKILSNVSMFYSSGTWNIGKDLKLNPSSTGSVSITTSAINVSMTVKGNFIGNGSGAFRLVNNTNGNVTLNIDGNIQINNGTMDLSNQNGGTSIINLKGDLFVSNAGKFLVTPATGTNTFTSNFNFIGPGDGLTPETTQTIDVVNQSTASNITFNVNNGAYVKVVNQNLSLGNNSKFNVLSGGSLNFGFNGSTANNIVKVSGATGTSFTQQPGSDLYITSPNGIQTTGALGNVQTDTRTFAIATPYADFHYIGNSPQVTGTGLPENVRDIIIDNTSATNEVTLTNTSSNFNVTRDLDIQQGIFNLNNKIVLGSGSLSNMNIKEFGTLKITGAREFPLGFNPIVFEPNSTVEYGGTTQTIAVPEMTNYANLPEYQNLVISGAGTKTAGGKNLVVNQKTTVNSGTLRIPETLIDEEPFVLHALGGIEVNSIGNLILENNANLMQMAGVENFGNINLIRNATVPSTQYNFWSSPVYQQDLYTLYPNIPAQRVMTYNTQTNYYDIVPAGTKSNYGIGYSIKGPSTGGDPVIATFIGTPNNESLTSSQNKIPLSNVGAGYNLVGNPYPSNLDLVKLYEANVDQFRNSNVATPTYFFWDNTGNTALTQMGSDYSGYMQNNYAVFNASIGEGTAATGGNGMKEPNGIVRPGQGFIMRAATNATELVLSNEMRTTEILRVNDKLSYYFKSNQNLTKHTSNTQDLNEKNNFRLELINPDDIYIKIFVGYFDQASNNFERFDSRIFSESVSENIYTLSEDNKKLAIQGRKGPFNPNDIIPLGVKTFKTGIYKINLTSKIGVFDNQKIYLKDKYKNKIHDFSEGEYQFKTGPGEFTDRFEIIFKRKNISASSQVSLHTAASGKIEIIKENEFISISSSNSQLKKVEIFNLSGKSIYQNTSINKTQLQIPAGMFGKEILIVNAETADGETLSKKLINN